ncbi:hypothetical protein C8Q70DRAFT_1031798, partial [Cubamyces menziesii]
MNSGSGSGGKKRTRSQLTLDKFDFVNLAHSPLKQAKSALKATNPTASASSSQNDVHQPETNGQQPNDGSHLKRPPSPAKDAAIHDERASKRPRHDIFPKLSSTSLPSLPSTSLAQPSSSALRRAVSVPPPSSSVVPLLDLNNVPPSPRRSPTKFRIASVPPEHPEAPQPKLPQLSFHPPSPQRPISRPSSRSPLSPLSPLPQTDDEPIPPHPKPDPPPPPIPIPSTSSGPPDTMPTRLPILSSVVSRMKPKQSPLAKKPRLPKKSTSSNAIRMTRSASLRQKKSEEEAKTKAIPTPAAAATPSRRRSMSMSYAQPTAASAAKATPGKPPSARPSMANPPSAAFTFTSTITPQVSRTRPSIAPRQPASSSTDAAGPSNTRPQHDVPVTGGRSSTDASGGATGAPLQLNSSLSTLNQALEKLNAPLPSRPNTSMGFHRESAASDGEGERDALRSSTGASGRPGSALAAVGPAASNAKGKGKMPIAQPTSKPPSSVKTGSSATRTQQQPQQQPQKKTLRQSLLMLPPPIPAPDKARAASRASSSTSTDGAATSSTSRTDNPAAADEARKKQVNLALAPSLGKVRNSLGFALPPDATPGSSSKIPGTAQKRIFTAATSSNTRAVFGGAGVGTGVLRAGARPSLTTGLRNGAPATRGFSARRGIGGRVMQRVSKKSSLPVVQGSPVKGGTVAMDLDLDDVMDVGEGSSTGANAEVEMDEAERERKTKERIGEWLKNASPDVLRDLGHTDGTEGGEGAAADVSANAHSSPAGPSSAVNDGSTNEVDAAAAEKEKEREREWRRNASRRASLASQLLTQSLSAVPDTPSPMGADAKGKGKLRAVSSSWPAPRAAEAQNKDGGERDAAGASGDGEGKDQDSQDMPPPPVPPPRQRVHNTRLATGALSTPPNAGSSRSSGNAGGSGEE